MGKPTLSLLLLTIAPHPKHTVSKYLMRAKLRILNKLKTIFIYIPLLHYKKNHNWKKFARKLQFYK